MDDIVKEDQYQESTKGDLVQDDSAFVKQDQQLDTYNEQDLVKYNQYLESLKRLPVQNESDLVKQEQNVQGDTKSEHPGIRQRISKNTKYAQQKAARGKRVCLKSEEEIKKPNEHRDYSTNGMLWNILMQKFFEEHQKEKSQQKSQVQIRNEIGGMEQNTFAKYKWAFNFIMKFSLPTDLLRYLIKENEKNLLI